MEIEKASLQIPCPLHPSETIQRVAIDKNANHHIYCLECIVQQKSRPGGASQDLKPLPEFIDAAATFFAKNREDTNLSGQIPKEMTDILSSQAEKLEAFTHHIEEEKKRVCYVFDSLTEELLKIIQEKKAEVLDKLDQQTSNLRLWYISFDQQLKKTFPAPEDIPVLYPTREDLLNRITNATELSALVKGIKDDINESTTSLEIKKKTAIHIMSKQLQEIAEMRSSYQIEGIDLLKLKGALNNEVSKLMKQAWNLQNSIPEVVTGLTAESAFLKPQDFGLIKSWLPQNLTFSPQLLFRGSRDGMDGPSFHRFCDGKENTITVIKAKFQGSDKVHVLGGYLDKPWSSNEGGFPCGTWIHSNDSFIFSITKNVKCPQGKKGAQYAAFSAAGQGPCFGHGYDISVWHQGMISCVSPTSYEKSNELLESPIVTKAKNPMAFIDVLDVEVYTVN